MINFRATAATAALLCFTAFGASPASADGEVNVYTYRETKLIQPLFDAFTKDTGVKVNVVSASSGLEQRMKAEGANSPADVLLTVDLGRLDDAVQAGVTQPIKSVVIDEIVPAQYRDPDGQCAGISMRARVIYASNDPEKNPWAEATKVILPTFEGGGTHVNLSGVILAKHAPNKANGVKLIEWLAGDKAQHIYADANYEYPIRAGVAVNPTIAGYGKLVAHPTTTRKNVANPKAASRL